MSNKTYTYDEIKDKVLEYFDGDDLAADVWIQKYSLKDQIGSILEQTPIETHKRMSKEFARIEEKYNQDKLDETSWNNLSNYGKNRKLLSKEKIFDYFDKFKYIIPQGSVMASLGNKFNYSSLSNCVVIPEVYDSYGGIMFSDQQLVQLFKRRCGVGLDISTLRPSGSITNNSAGTSTGAISFMERYSNTTREVAQCLHGDTLILTKSGLNKIKNIKIGTKVWTKNGWIKVINTLKNKKPLKVITTKFGNKLICSEDHVIHTINGEKPLKDINIGDQITSIIGNGWDGTNKKFKNNPYKRIGIDRSNCLNDSIKIPERMNENIAYFLGYSYGDGYMSKDGSELCLNELTHDLNLVLIQDHLKSVDDYDNGKLNDVYDLSLEKEHLFFANGIYVHNSGRRGALMLTIDVKHIDIEEFITIKQDLKKVTGANISVRLSNEFMEAVKNDTDFTLQFPIKSDNPEITNVIKAKDLWNKIITAAHASAEPGLIFWDRQHWYSTSSVYPNYLNVSTNPCGEICMGGGDSCRLISLNMFSCVVNPFTDGAYFDFDKWYEIVYEGQRLNDDLVDLELESIDRIFKKIDNDIEPDFIKDVEYRTWKLLYDTGKNGRRTGLGFTAMGDTLASLNLKYDSDESVSIIDKICKRKCEAEFDSSIDMAIERGKFKDFDTKIEKTSHFVQMLKTELPHIYNRMMKHGRRNISISTIAPNGSVSLIAQTTSGIEPLFMVEPYERRKKVLNNDKFDFEDEIGDKWQIFDVYHPKIKMYLDINPDKKVEDSAYVSASKIDWEKRILIQSTIQKYVTHSISSTINLDSDTTIEKVGDIYLRGWEMGLKGVTIYRDGSRSGVLVSKNDNKENPYGDEDSNAPRRPKVLPCDIIRFTNKGEKWIAFIGMHNFNNGNGELRPYEIFTGLQDSFPVPSYVENGEIVKTKKDGVSRYDFIYKDKDGYPMIMTGLNRVFNKEFWNMGKMLSAILRHRMPLKHVADLIDSLRFTEDSIVTWKAGIRRIIRKYIKEKEETGEICPDCGGKVIREAGCDHCVNCAYSAKCS